MGRPTKLNNEVIEKYCKARSIGSSVEVAALYAGVSDSVIPDWISKGEALREKQSAGEAIERKDRVFLRFLEQVEVAEANAAITWQQVVDKAASVDAVWAWRMLRQRYPKGYSDPAPPPQTVVNIGPQYSAEDFSKARQEARAFEIELVGEEPKEGEL